MTCTIDEWAGAATAASIDIAIQVLGLDAAILLEPGEPFAAPFAAYVPLSSSDSHIQLGIVAELSDCERMSRTLLCLSNEEPVASDGDVADAIGEIANMVAGATKTMMNPRIPDIVLGLPLCVRGRIETQAVEQVATELLVGSMRVRIVLLRSPHAGPKSRPRAAS